MSTIETILSRAMSDPVFAEALFADPEKALAEYELPADVLARFKSMSRAEFEALGTEERKSMATLIGQITTTSGVKRPSNMISS
jgi:hypothetical protein